MNRVNQLPCTKSHQTGLLSYELVVSLAVFFGNFLVVFKFKSLTVNRGVKVFLNTHEAVHLFNVFLLFLFVSLFVLQRPSLV